MLSFYEMLRLIENDFEGDYYGGDTGHTPRKPIEPQGPVIRRKGNSGEEDAYSQIAGATSRGLKKRSQLMVDPGRHLDGPTIGKGHFIGNPDSGFEPGAAIPRGHLANSMRDITATGREDVPELPNPTKPSLKVNQSVGYSSHNKEWEKMLDDKLDFISQIQDVTPDKVDDHIKALLKWNQELRKHPGISPDLKEKTYQVDDMILDLLEKEQAKQNRPAEDSPRQSPMAKFMLAKNSKTF